MREEWYCSACSTHRGRRTANEDAVVIAPLPGGGEVVALADGMGGHAAGDVASATALDTFVREIRTGTAVARAVRSANSVVHDTAERIAACRGMGTTLVAVVRNGASYQIVNVGDSRAYRIDGMGIQQITADHSFIAEAVRQGGLSAEEVARSPWRNALTRSLGTGAEVDVDVFGPFTSDGTPHLVVLCSDGIHKVLTDTMIRQVALSAEDASAAAGTLSAAAYQCGSDDNITAAVLEFGRLFHPQDVPTEPFRADPRSIAAHRASQVAATATS